MDVVADCNRIVAQKRCRINLCCYGRLWTKVMDEKIICFPGVSKSYRQASGNTLWALRNVDIDVMDGRMWRLWVGAGAASPPSCIWRQESRCRTTGKSDSWARLALCRSVNVRFNAGRKSASFSSSSTSCPI